MTLRGVRASPALDDAAKGAVFGNGRQTKVCVSMDAAAHKSRDRGSLSGRFGAAIRPGFIRTNQPVVRRKLIGCEGASFERIEK